MLTNNFGDFDYGAHAHSTGYVYDDGDIDGTALSAGDKGSVLSSATMPAQLPSSWGVDHVGAWANANAGAGVGAGKGSLMAGGRGSDLNGPDDVVPVTDSMNMAVMREISGAKINPATGLDVSAASLDDVYANVMEALSEVNTSEAGDSTMSDDLRSNSALNAAVRAQQDATNAAAAAAAKDQREKAKSDVNRAKIGHGVNIPVDSMMGSKLLGVNDEYSMDEDEILNNAYFASCPDALSAPGGIGMSKALGQGYVAGAGSTGGQFG